MLKRSCLCLAALAIIGLSCFRIYSQSGPRLAASAVDNTVVLSGQSFRANEAIDVIVYGQNLYLTTDVILGKWTAYANAKGRVQTTWIPTAATGLVTVSMTGLSSGRVASTRFVPPNAPVTHTFNLDQCRNGTIDTPLTCTGANWVNGNLNASQAHFIENDSVPYRLVFGGMTIASTHTLTLEYDTTQGGHHAMDYLTSFNRTETDASPCDGIASCDPFVHSHMAIPLDPAVIAGHDGVTGTADDIVQIPGDFTLFGGTITGVSSYTVVGSYAGNSSTSVTITFTTSVTDPVLAWSSHIATRGDWGFGNSAIAISGSPFHMRILDSDGEGGGNQDRGVAGDAVYYPGTIVIIEDARPHSLNADFWFDGTGTYVSGFWLDDDGQPATHWSDTQLFGALNHFGTANQYTFVQTVPFPYDLASLACTSDPQGGTGTDNNTISLALRQVAVTLEEGELVTCTFVNQAPTAAQVAISGRVMAADGSGIRNAAVSFTTPGGVKRSVMTNAFGYYIFSGVNSGQNYIVRAQSKGFGFNPQILTVNDSLTNVNFTAVH